MVLRDDGLDHAERLTRHGEVVHTHHVVAGGSGEQRVLERDINVGTRIRKQRDVLALAAAFVHRGAHSLPFTKHGSQNLCRMWRERVFGNGLRA